MLIREPVRQVEDDEHGRRYPHGPQVDVVARLLDLACHSLLEIHLGQGGLRGVRLRLWWKQEEGKRGRKREK